MPRTGDILGYARVSTADQDLSGQKDRLLQHGAVRVFEDVISGKTFNRPGLAALLDQARPNDTLAVIRLDRLGRSLKELLKTVDDLKAREINLISLEERIDTTSAAGELAPPDLGAHQRRTDQRPKAWSRPWATAIAARNNLSSPRPRRRRKIRLTSRQTPRHRQVNSLQGDQKRHTVTRVQDPFSLSVVLRRNLPMGPISMRTS